MGRAPGVSDPVQLRLATWEGLSDSEIADRFGCSARTVLRWRTRYDIPSLWVPPMPEHGTVTCYQHHGCRCVLCKAAWAARQRRWAYQLNRRTALTAARQYEPWTPDEDAVLLAHTPMDAAALLQRSWHACVSRRSKLRQEVATA